MTEHEYMTEVMRTCAATSASEQLLLGAMGLAGESGEVVDLIKKARFQGHALDMEKLQGELGDVLWYLVLLCQVLGLSLTDVMAYNVAKMHRRYPNGFEAARSQSRSE